MLLTWTRHIGNKVVYRVMKAAGLLQKPHAALYPAADLFELLPAGPNELWQGCFPRPRIADAPTTGLDMTPRR